VGLSLARRTRQLRAVPRIGLRAARDCSLTLWYLALSCYRIILGSVVAKMGVAWARIDAELKHNVEALLGKLGLSVSEAIRIYFRMIELNGGVAVRDQDPQRGDRGGVPGHRSGQESQALRRCEGAVRGPRPVMCRPVRTPRFKKEDVALACRRGKDLGKLRRILERLIAVGALLGSSSGLSPHRGRCGEQRGSRGAWLAAPLQARRGGHHLRARSLSVRRQASPAFTSPSLRPPTRRRGALQVRHRP